MADKLEWMNKHFVLMRYKTVQEAVEKEKYKLRPDLAEFVTADPMGAEDFVYHLQEKGKFKEACDFLSYIMHRRAAIWWGYNCMLSLVAELEINPAVERDIADIGAPKEMEVPEWAKFPPELEAELAAADAETNQHVNKIKSGIDSLVGEMQKAIPPEVQNIFDEMFGVVNDKFKAEHGLGVMDLLQKVAARAGQNAVEIDEKSPIFLEVEKLEKEIEEKRKETIELIKSVLPPKMPEHQKKLRDNAMQAVYRWVVAPDEGNSQAALDIGNECPDQPAGLLAMAAFWSYGNLTPEGKQVIQTPAGLAANGINSALLQAALHQGGTRKYKERCEHYLELGLQVIRGENMWDEALAEKVSPHNTAAEQTPPLAAEPASPVEPQSVYKKWNPNQK